MLWTKRFSINWTKEPLPFLNSWTENPMWIIKWRSDLLEFHSTLPFSGRNMDTLFNSIDRSKVQGYHDFMQAIILEAISRHNFTFDELNTFLFNHNKEIFEHVCEKAIAYFDDYAPKSLKSCGNWRCPGNDVIALFILWTLTSMRHCLVCLYYPLTLCLLHSLTHDVGCWTFYDYQWWR